MEKARFYCGTDNDWSDTSPALVLILGSIHSGVFGMHTNV